MNKGFKLFTLAFALLFAITVKVNAAEVSVADEATLETCVATAENVCKLSADVELTHSLEVGKKVTIDLNGFDIVAKDGMTDDSLIIVLHGGTLTIKGEGSVSATNANAPKARIAVKMSKGGNTEAFINENPATLVLESGTLEGTSFGISGNGNPDRVNTNVTINGGVVKGGATGVFHPQAGTITVNAGEVTGKTGIEMRAGKLVVKGGTIVGTAVPTETKENGSGTTTTGAGIAIVQHTTEKDLAAVVEGGTVKGYTALYHNNTEDNSDEAAAKVSLKVTGGTFEATNEGKNAIYSDAKENFITGGEFKGAVDEKFVSEDLETKVIDGVTYVGTSIPKEEAKVEEKNPNTGDNVLTYIIIGLMSLIAFVYASNKLRKNA